MPLPCALAAPLRWLRRPRVWLAVVAGGTGLYALLGFTVVPRVVEKQLPTRLSALLGRPVRLGRVAFNPFNFRLVVEGFAVMEPDGEILVGFDRLRVNLQTRSLFGRDVVLERVMLEGFRARYQLLSEGRTNLSDILARLKAPPAEGTTQPATALPEAATPGTTPRTLHVRSFRLEGARSSFEDRRGPDVFRAEFGPYALELEDFRTGPGGRTSHQLVLKGVTGETLVWSGTLGLDPLRSEGALYLEHVSLPRYARYWRPYVGFEVRKGTGMIQAAYAFGSGAGDSWLRFSRGSLRLSNLELAPQTGGPSEARIRRGGRAWPGHHVGEHEGGRRAGKAGARSPLVHVRSLNLEGITYDLFGGKLQVDDLVVEEGNWTLTRAKDGALSLPRLFLGTPTPTPAMKGSTARSLELARRPPVDPHVVIGQSPFTASVSAPLPAPKTGPRAARRTKAPVRPASPPSDPFRLRVNRIRILNQRFAFEDRFSSDPVRTSLHLSRLEAGPFTLDPTGVTPLKLQATLETGGILALTGELQPLQSAFRAEVTLAGVQLPPFRSYLAGPLKAPLLSGGLSTRLRLEGDFSQAARLSAHGDLNLTDLVLEDPQDGGALATFPGIAVKGLAFDLSPWGLRGTRLELDQPSVLYRLEPGGSNVVRALGLSRPAVVPPEAASHPAPTPPAPGRPNSILGRAASPVAASRPPVRLESLAVRGGSFRIEDTTTRPAARVTLERVELEGGGFSTEPGPPGTLRLRTHLDGVTPVAVQGRFNLLAPQADSDLALQTRGWDLAPMAPYLAQYLGYAFRKGKLDLDVAWKVRRGQLQAENRARLDQFYLGDKVPGPDAIHAPVKLGLALLRDRHGVIEADIPVAGSLDAPDFKLRKAVWKAVGTLFTKLAASPFDALARLVGAKQDLSQAPFRAGTADLDAEGLARVEALAKALQERPALRVEVVGAVNPLADEAALRRQALDAKLQRMRTPPAPFDPSERPALLQAAWRAAHPAAKGEETGPEPALGAMERALLEGLPAPDLQALGARRASRAQEALVHAGIDVARIFRVAGMDPKPMSGVRFRIQ